MYASAKALHQNLGYCLFAEEAHLKCLSVCETSTEYIYIYISLLNAIKLLVRYSIGLKSSYVNESQDRHKICFTVCSHASFAVQTPNLYLTLALQAPANFG